MICKIVTLLSILSISAYRIESNEILLIAISSQSFHHDDLPLPYKFSPIRDHKHKNRNKRSDPLFYNSIQYAPLPDEAKNKEHTVQENEVEQNEYKSVIAPGHLIDGGRHVYSTEAIISKDHLEPRLEENNLIEHRHRSKIPADNVQLIPQPSGYLGPFDASFILAHEDKIRTEEKPHNKQHFAYYKKAKQHLEETSTTFLGEEEQTRTSEIPVIRRILPKEKYAAFLPDKFRVEENIYSLHNELAKEKRQQLYQHIPRLHLNTARIYNIANTPKKPLPPANVASSHVKTRGLWTEYYRPLSADQKKTILHPVPS